MFRILEVKLSSGVIKDVDELYKEYLMGQSSADLFRRGVVGTDHYLLVMLEVVAVERLVTDLAVDEVRGDLQAH
jgi:hypothetical protein